MSSKQSSYMPLAARMRPKKIEDYVGQEHLTAPGKPIFQAVKEGHLHSMIFWGPPGTGKTTLAEIIANSVNARVEKISAVLAGVKDIREVVKRAELALSELGQRTVLFVDEVHRFNKSQQDAFLPHVESGLITLIGATTENPSFELNNALLSRARVYVLKALDESALSFIVDNVLKDSEKGIGNKKLKLTNEVRDKIIAFADGDARRCLNTLEIIVDFAKEDESGCSIISDDELQEVLRFGARRFDKQGEAFYDQISALHKSVRGSDPHAAVYWLCRMLDGGCDRHYIARRVVRMATEDIGNADPRGLHLALDAWETFDRLGSPEGELAIAQAVIYLASAAKSNAVYMAFNKAMDDAKRSGSLEVPIHLRNAPTKLMKDLGYHQGYRYAHDEPDAFAAGERYLPDKLKSRRYYEPVERGLESQIKAKLDMLDKRNKNKRA